MQCSILFSECWKMGRDHRLFYSVPQWTVPNFKRQFRGQLAAQFGCCFFYLTKTWNHDYSICLAMIKLLLRIPYSWLIISKQFNSATRLPCFWKPTFNFVAHTQKIPCRCFTSGILNLWRFFRIWGCPIWSVGRKLSYQESVSIVRCSILVLDYLLTL